MINVEGWVYLIHLDRPLGDPARPRMSASHYTGWANPGGLLARMLLHKSGGGSKMLAAAKAAGIGWHLVALERGTRARERQLKQRGAARRCPVCRARVAQERAAEARGLVLAA